MTAPVWYYQRWWKSRSPKSSFCGIILLCLHNYWSLFHGLIFLVWNLTHFFRTVLTMRDAWVVADGILIKCLSYHLSEFILYIIVYPLYDPPCILLKCMVEKRIFVAPTTMGWKILLCAAVLQKTFPSTPSLPRLCFCVWVESYFTIVLSDVPSPNSSINTGRTPESSLSETLCSVYPSAPCLWSEPWT